ncbi:MAG TPA: magnesium and cobalt transport protein CorA [Thermoanaerobaculia bacterium]|nr:magnesium and cobalt transport protein CorA [Thermoanaerobaculia bacterium]
MDSRPIIPPAAPSATPMVVNLSAYDTKGRRLPPISLDEISDVLERPDTFVWMGLHEPDEALLLKLQEEFGLHHLAIEDAHKAHQRPKIEVWGDSLFIVLRTAQVVDRKCRFGETHAFLGPRYLVTVRHGPSLSYEPVRIRVEREPELLALGASYCFYAVFDFIIDNFQPIVAEFQDELEALETAIFEHQFKRETVERLYDLKRELVTLRLAIAPAQDISNQLVLSHSAQIRDEVRPYLRDVHDHVVRVKESSDAMSEMVSAAVTLNLAMVSVGQGEVVKRLAGWAALLAAPTLIASWYGMNFRHMPELFGRFSYGVVAAGTAVICLLLYRVLKRARWL